ncbi:MAG: hypothetical protein ABI721_04610 [Candidatus Dojkabacteria bacterium]
MDSGVLVEHIRKRYKIPDIKVNVLQDKNSIVFGTTGVVILESEGNSVLHFIPSGEGDPDSLELKFINSLKFVLGFEALINFYNKVRSPRVIVCDPSNGLKSMMKLIFKDFGSSKLIHWRSFDLKINLETFCQDIDYLKNNNSEEDLKNLYIYFKRLNIAKQLIS